MNTTKLLQLAAQVSRLKDDDRTYYIGAVGVRKDGVIVCSANGCPKFPERKHHAEYRVLRKLGKHGTLYIVRTLADGTWADCTPCEDCQKAIRSAKVDRVVFTINKYIMGVWTLKWQDSPYEAYKAYCSPPHTSAA